MDGTDNTLLVIGSGLRMYREYLVRPAAAHARSLGLELVLVNNLEPTWQHRYFDEIEVVNVFEHPVLFDAARRIAARRTVVGVMCWDEPLVMPAAVLADEFGVPGLGADGVLGCRDKHRTRTLLAAAGIAQPASAMVHGARQAAWAAARIGYPVVVKPRALGASMGVVLAADESELQAAYRIASDASLVGDEPYRGGALIEQFASGDEISIDAAVHKGEYLPMFVARKRTGLFPYFEEIGHVVDAADPLLGDHDLMGMLAQAHEVLGVENGLTHTEVRLTPRGPVIIEVNGRLGGDLIPFLGRTATGIDPGVVIVDVALGRRPELVTTRRQAAGIRFGYPEQDCAVRSVRVPGRGPGLVLAEPMADPGTVLRLPPGGYIARHSFVVCEAADTAQCDARLDTAAALVELDAEPVEPPPSGSTLTMPAGLLDVDA
jgi:biotin carboxylase